MTRGKIAQVATIDLSIRFLLLDHIQALQAAGYEVVAICSPGPWVEQLRRMGINVETVEMARELAPIRDLQSLLALRRCFRRHGFDVVHTHTPKAGLIGPLAARLAGVPKVVHTIHGLLFHDRMPRWRRWLFWLPERFTASCAKYLLSQSREDVEVALRTHLCRPGKIEWLGNGIDVESFAPARVGAAGWELRRSLGIADSDFVVGSVGRLVYDKGFGELFAAAESITAAHPEVKFVVIGPEEHGQQNDAVPAARLAALQAKGAVRFLGWRNDTPQCYAMMDLFVLPSHREGVPRACMEASASGLPVIATDIRGCREVVKHGETGLLVPVRDPVALAAAIERLRSDRSLARAMGEAGRRHIVANFNHQQVLDRLLAFYSRIAPLARRAAAAGARGK